MSIRLKVSKSSDLVGGFNYLYHMVIYSLVINYSNSITMLPCIYAGGKKNLPSRMHCEIFAGWH